MKIDETISKIYIFLFILFPHVVKCESILFICKRIITANVKKLHFKSKFVRNAYFIFVKSVIFHLIRRKKRGNFLFCLMKRG